MVRRSLFPLALTISRLALAPFMAWLALSGNGSDVWLVVCLYIGMLSDLLDGIVARRLNVATPALRRFDSRVDLVFWLTALRCVWYRHSEIVRAHYRLVICHADPRVGDLPSELCEVWPRSREILHLHLQPSPSNRPLLRRNDAQAPALLHDPVLHSGRAPWGLALGLTRSLLNWCRMEEPSRGQRS
jgi:hypothetical protein